MKLSQKAISFIIEKLSLPAGSDEATVKSAFFDEQSAATPRVTLDQIKTIQAEAGSAGENRIREIMREEIKSMNIPTLDAIVAAVKSGAPAATIPAATTPVETLSDANKAYANAANGGGGAQGMSIPGDGAELIRVKSVVEQYRDDKTAALYSKSSNPLLKHFFGNQQVMSSAGGTEGFSYAMDEPTERSKAITGAWMKLATLKALRRNGQAILPQYELKQHDRDLLMYAANESRFVGPVRWKGNVNDDTNGDDAEMWLGGERLKEVNQGDMWIKALLDDSTSGGLEAVPIEFDASVILTPLLHGQLFPLVNIINVTRRRIEATKFANPSMYWGTSEGTAIDLFDTDGFISAFDNNIYPITGAMEIGLDFLADSPLAVGAIVQRNYGQAFLKAMDDVVATGTGTNQPEGLFVASGVTAITETGTSAAPTVGDYELLMFGISKAFRDEPGARPVFVSNDTQYQRARGIPVDSSADQRRVFGMDEMSYRLFDMPYRVNGTLTNLQVGAFCMNRYRMYRRQGLEVRTIREDWTLARQNQEGIVLRARFGGSLELGAAGAKFDYNS